MQAMASGDVIWLGDAGAALDSLEDRSVACAVTSPPYWRQRDYGFEDQIGREEDYREYLGRLVSVFSILRTKLREDGVFFLNVGDKYLDRYGSSHLMGLPYKLACHLRREGWKIEDILIWHKTNHMPSPAADRFTNAYEPVLVLTRGEGSIYRGRGMGKVLEVPLQQVPWKHAATFPERLVRDLFDRAALRSGDLVLDPFAGTGTTAVVARRMRGWIFPVRVRCAMVEASAEFAAIMRRRTGIRRVRRPEGDPPAWSPVEETLELPGPIDLPTRSKRGEVLLAGRAGPPFLGALATLGTEEYRSLHRADALYFLGSREWELGHLYAASMTNEIGLVLRNILAVSDGEGGWYPVCMLAAQSTMHGYRFDLDAVRADPVTEDARDWWATPFQGMLVRDPLGGREGEVEEVLSTYPDDFPALVSVRWPGGARTAERSVHPDREVELSEGLRFFCPECGAALEEPYDPLGENRCQVCGTRLWKGGRIPEVAPPPHPKEWTLPAAAPSKVSSRGNGPSLEARGGGVSKFSGMDRINRGQSPAARAAVDGEAFSLMRLYEIDQRLVYRYLTMIREARGLSVADIRRTLPPEYEHKVGHWFRGDISGSIPVPEDSARLRLILGVEDGVLRLLEDRGLFFQAVRNSPKGKNPGDFLECHSPIALQAYLRRLYL